MSSTDIFNRLSDAIKLAKANGATDAAISYARSNSLSASVRLGKIEDLEEAASGEYAFSVYVGKSCFSGGLSSIRDSKLKAAIEGAVAAAKVAPPNIYAGLADPDQIAKSYPVLDSFDPSAPSAKALTDAALATEEAALSGKNITDSKGGGSWWGQTESWAMATNGFMRQSISSGNSISVSIIASHGNKMETDYGQSTAVYRTDLQDTADVGKEAARRAASKLNARKPETGNVPVVFDPRIGSKLLGTFAAAVSGMNIARGRSFLKNAMGQRVFAENVRIVDDPLMPRGLGTRACDGDGILSKPLTLIEEGVLQSWLLSLESARQLKLETTGHASGVSNLSIAAGDLTPEELIADIKEGFYVTNLMGHGANIINGTFSQGASGLWIKDGRISEQAISEATIAGDLGPMFLRLVPANDLNKKAYKIAVPTLRVEGMTVAG